MSHGLIWKDQSEDTTTFIRCSELHSNFRSGTYASRKCSGEWGNVNLTDCTMYAYTDPVVVTQATITPANWSAVFIFNASVSNQLFITCIYIHYSGLFLLSDTYIHRTISKCIMLHITYYLKHCHQFA